MKVCPVGQAHSEYVISVAFRLQQWLHERDSILRLYLCYLSCYYSKHSLVHCQTSKEPKLTFEDTEKSSVIMVPRWRRSVASYTTVYV